jgi:hypothetical protein
MRYVVNAFSNLLPSKKNRNSTYPIAPTNTDIAGIWLPAIKATIKNVYRLISLRDFIGL